MGSNERRLLPRVSVSFRGTFIFTIIPLNSYFVEIVTESVPLFLFYDTFNERVSSSGYVVLNDRIINNKW
jgi:hypothetical protein